MSQLVEGKGTLSAFAGLGGKATGQEGTKSTGKSSGAASRGFLGRGQPGLVEREHGAEETS